MVMMCEGGPFVMACASQKRKFDELTSEEKKQRSRERNRQHARATRERKKEQLSLLQNRVHDLQTEGSRLVAALQSYSMANALLNLSHNTHGAAEGDDPRARVQPRRGFDAVELAAAMNMYGDDASDEDDAFNQTSPRAVATTSPAGGQRYHHKLGSTTAHQGSPSSSSSTTTTTHQISSEDASSSSSSFSSSSSEDGFSSNEVHQSVASSSSRSSHYRSRMSGFFFPAAAAAAASDDVNNGLPAAPSALAAPRPTIHWKTGYTLDDHGIRKNLSPAELDSMRRERNRLHAKMTRDRKKHYIQTLSRAIAALEEENDRYRAMLTQQLSTTLKLEHIINPAE